MKHGLHWFPRCWERAVCCCVAGVTAVARPIGKKQCTAPLLTRRPSLGCGCAPFFQVALSVGDMLLMRVKPCSLLEIAACSELSDTEKHKCGFLWLFLKTPQGLKCGTSAKKKWLMDWCHINRMHYLLVWFQQGIVCCTSTPAIIIVIIALVLLNVFFFFIFTGEMCFVIHIMDSVCSDAYTTVLTKDKTWLKSHQNTLPKS